MRAHERKLRRLAEFIGTLASGKRQLIGETERVELVAMLDETRSSLAYESKPKRAKPKKQREKSEDRRASQMFVASALKSRRERVAELRKTEPEADPELSARGVGPGGEFIITRESGFIVDRLDERAEQTEEGPRVEPGPGPLSLGTLLRLRRLGVFLERVRGEELQELTPEGRRELLVTVEWVWKLVEQFGALEEPQERERLFAAMVARFRRLSEFLERIPKEELQGLTQPERVELWGAIDRVITELGRVNRDATPPRSRPTREEFAAELEAQGVTGAEAEERMDIRDSHDPDYQEPSFHGSGPETVD